jgi:hypothetical protein
MAWRIPASNGRTRQILAKRESRKTGGRRRMRGGRRRERMARRSAGARLERERFLRAKLKKCW